MARKVSPPNEPIAIVGCACRFAGDANNPSKLWELLRDPKDIRKEVPESRFNINGYYHPDYAHLGHANVKESYFLNEDPSAFDAGFFGINPIEGSAMDPQQRFLLEVVYESIESAGMTIEGLKGSDTAVFAGVMVGDYEAMQLRDVDSAPTYCAVGTSRAILSNRVSYFFDWHGASVTSDTACSSSLVAVHQAIQALRTGDSRMAVACGSNIILGPESYIMESKVKMLSPTGQSRMWDKDADGYARGDGVATLVLKTLSAALEDGDNIQCIIRESGVNQDGATPGLTMPSPTAQRDLIKRTYEKAGLDLRVQEDRPQYFEAHGTGTPAGDPVEAEAISSAFYAGNKSSITKFNRKADDLPLFVGSIKTVLGHTEGTAGIAAVLKTMLAIQNSTVPPNLLFDALSPAVEPFYDNLEILKAARPWPSVPKGQPRRASVNCFGFGGTNVHLILESYEPKPLATNGYSNGVTNGHNGSITNEDEASHDDALFTPFVFSAASDQSLRANLQGMSHYLEQHPDTNSLDLAHTLVDRRTLFSHRVAFPARDLEQLKTDIQTTLEDQDKPLGIRKLTKGSGDVSKILAVFTGQGAQYAGMAAELIKESPLARQIIQDLEADLARLPAQDRPQWSLQAEILAGKETSRLGESAISQPLNTAIQIMLVDLLRAAKVHFAAIVGHSGGEVAAAYAAGYLSARDALCVAYYRGMNCSLAESPNGKDIQGAMLAVGTTPEDAKQLCAEDGFAGRLSLAAVNSPSSVTISGDEDAVEELALVMEDEKKFNRRLKVDKAYHSKHMVPAAEPYLEGIKRAGVKSRVPSRSTAERTSTWFSSVFDGKVVDPAVEDLSGSYWVENMVRPVLFAQAVTAALESGISFDAAIEIGPHPSLKSPATQNIQAILPNSPIPYTGALTRGGDAVVAFSSALGFLWSHLEKGSVDMGSCQLGLSSIKGARDNDPKHPFSLLTDLPSYHWNHDTKYWHESRRSRQMRLRPEAVHPLLGHSTPDCGPHMMRWKNVLKVSELQWLEGHSVQGQVVFPASGYVSTLLEAAKHLVEGDNTIRLIEIDDFIIAQAVTFSSQDPGIEVLIELSQISRTQPGFVEAKFTYSAALGSDSTDLTLAAEGMLKIILGPTSDKLLPERDTLPPHMMLVEDFRMYNYMESLEYNFTGAFRSLTELRRKLGIAACVAKRAQTDDSDLLMMHPVDLDAAFQSINLAYSYPGDDQLRDLHLPTKIVKIRANPAVIDEQRDHHETLDVDSTCNPEDRHAPASGFSGNVNIYFPGFANAAVQVDQVIFKPVGAVADDRNDREIFDKMDYVHMKPDGVAAAHDILVTDYEVNLMYALSRLVNYFVRQFNEMVPEDSPHRSESPLCHYLNYARYVAGLLERRENPFAKNEWIHDTFEDVMVDINAKGVADNIDVRIMLLVGKTMPQVFAGETTMLEHFRTSGLLDEYYAHGFGTGQSSQWLGNAVKQITDIHPHLRLLEVGAGTGGATHFILPAIGRDFDSYTFTDISSSFFENAAEVFSPWVDRMTFQVLDAESDPMTQGFVEHSYDALIACQVLHATAKLDETLRNLRRLLRPGGYLLIGEGSSEGMAQLGAGFIFGTLPGWWRGVDEGRTLSPLASASHWDGLLKRNGFSGIDTMSPHIIFETFGAILMVSQAVDPKLELVREPFNHYQERSAKIPELLFIGGKTPPTSKVIRELQSKFHGIGVHSHVFKSLEDLDDRVTKNGAAIISLTDLDDPVFRDMGPERWEKFKMVFGGEKSVLWLTKGRLEDDPYCNMTVGFGRSALHEEQGLRMQFIDVPDLEHIDVKSVAEHFVRLMNRDLDLEDILYGLEPEIVVDEKGRELVPRLGHITEANHRLNSTRRPITRQVDLQKAPVELKQDDSGCFIRQLSRYETSEDIIGTSTPDDVDFRARFANLTAIRTPIGPQYLALGEDSKGSRQLALVPSLLSSFRVHKDAVVACPLGDQDEDPVLLALAAAELTAMAIIDPMYAGQQVIVHNASLTLAGAIAAQAEARGVRTVFSRDSSDENDSSIPDDWITIPRYVRRSDLAQLIPSVEAACYVGLSQAEKSENELTIISTLPRHCRIESTQSLYSGQTVDSGITSQKILGHILDRVVKSLPQRAASNKSTATSSTSVSLADLIGNEKPTDPLTVVDFNVSVPLPARVTRFELTQLFRTDKTYWLVGLSGALGISLCDWMIERGMRYLAITSRNPKIDPAWIENHARNGVVIKRLACDVTDEAALRKVHETIVKTMPPIVGALNGAMVLRDVTIANMSYDNAFDVIRPKVLGSLNMDRIFHDIDLDFFILLSSASCVIGNVGQANYVAANMGMCNVAAMRRKRGLRSSVANVGAIIGIGYITESAHQLDLTVANQHLTHLNEEDFHQIFAEVMEAGYLDSPMGPEIVTGIRQVSTDDDNMPVWFTDPKFGRLMIHNLADGDDANNAGKDSSITENLQACKNAADVFQVVKESFSAQLRKTLQISTSDDDLMNMRSSDLGLDSLISVDIRSWFLKNFRVSIPVLKIMASDAQMIGLVEAAAEGVPAELIPLVEGAKPSSAIVPEEDINGAANGMDHGMAAHDHSANGASGDVDWEAEATPPASGFTPEATLPNPKPEVVVLTGASGLLGHHLLNALSEQPSIRKIFCIGIRRLKQRLESGELPPANSRIIYFEGDLGEPHFGLSEEDEAMIFSQADAIIHNGADTSHLKHYDQVRASNVLSTRRLLEHALRRMLPFHYVSSAGMALFAGGDAFRSVSGTIAGKTPQDDRQGYMCSKWVCESMLERANAAYGLPAWIHRPSTIIREGKDAIGKKADFDWVNTLIHYCHKVQAVPKIENNKGAFDLVYVKTCCDDIVGGLIGNTPDLSNGMTYLNNVGDHVVWMDRMAEIASHKGKPGDLYEVVSWDDWMEKALDAGLHPAVAALVEVFDEPGAPTYPMLLREKA